MQASIYPINQVLTNADKAYLSRLFVTKEDFSANQAITNERGLFLVFGNSVQSNLDTTLGIFEFLQEQKQTEASSRSLVHWTKNSHRYIDNSAFDDSTSEAGEYHFTDFKELYKVSKPTHPNEHVFIYTDELSSGVELSHILLILQQKRRAVIFMHVISETYEDAMLKLSNLYGSSMHHFNIGSLSSNNRTF